MFSDGGHEDDFSVEQFDAVVRVEDAHFHELLKFFDRKTISVRVRDHPRRVAWARAIRKAARAFPLAARG